MYIQKGNYTAVRESEDKLAINIQKIKQPFLSAQEAIIK